MNAHGDTDMNDDLLLYSARNAAHIALIFILPVAIFYGTIICCAHSSAIFKTSLDTVRNSVQKRVPNVEKVVSRLFRNVVHRWPDSLKVKRHRKRCKFKRSGWRKCKCRKGCKKKKRRNQKISRDSNSVLHCDKCKIQVDYLVQCEKCYIWYCGLCSKVPERAIELFEDGNGCHWFCQTCNAIAMNAVHNCNCNHKINNAENIKQPEAAPPQPEAAPPQPEAALPQPEAAPPQPEAALPQPEAAPPQPEAALVLNTSNSVNPPEPSTSDSTSPNEQRSQSSITLASATENQSITSNENTQSNSNNTSVQQNHVHSHSTSAICHGHPSIRESEQFILVLPVAVHHESLPVRDTDCELDEVHLCYGNQKGKCDVLQAVKDETPSHHWQNTCGLHQLYYSEN